MYISEEEKWPKLIINKLRSMEINVCNGSLKKRAARQLFPRTFRASVRKEKEEGCSSRALYRDTTKNVEDTRGVYSFGQPSSVGLIAIERSSLISSLSRSGEFEAGTATK